MSIQRQSKDRKRLVAELAKQQSQKEQQMKAKLQAKYTKIESLSRKFKNQRLAKASSTNSIDHMTNEDQPKPKYGMATDVMHRRSAPSLHEIKKIQSESLKPTKGNLPRQS